MKNDNQKAKYNPINERAKFNYHAYLRRINRNDSKTIIAALKHIRDFEIFTNFAGFEKFNDVVADKYITAMLQKGLSLSYVTSNIRALKDFLNWLERQRGYRSKIKYDHIEYLNISQNQRNTAKALEYQKSYTLDVIVSVIRAMPAKTDTDRRNKAMVSLQALCALRISELRTVKLKNLIEESSQYFIYVCPKSMDTKFAKTRHVDFMALPIDIVQNVLDWRGYLMQLGFKDNDPLFPRIDARFRQDNMVETSVQKQGIASNTTMRDVFKRAFEASNQPYINPHSFRKTHARYAASQSPAYLNAIRQNLGHSSIDTTLNSYGQLSTQDQRNIISGVRV